MERVYGDRERQREPGSAQQKERDAGAGKKSVTQL